MKKRRKGVDAGEVLAVPLSGDRWVYICCFGSSCRLYKTGSNGIINNATWINSRNWLGSFTYSLVNWSVDCKTVGHLVPREGGLVEEWPEFYRDRGPEYGDNRYEHVGFNLRIAISWEDILKKNLPLFIYFNSLPDLREYLESFAHEMVWIDGEAAIKKPAKKEPLAVTLEFRNVIAVFDKKGPRPGGYQKGLAELRGQGEAPTVVGGSAVPRSQFDLDKELERVFAELEREIRKLFRDGEYDAQLVEVLAREDKLRIQAPVSEVKSIISFLRRQFIVDAYDHWNYSYLEIEQRGPAPGEWKIFGSKGPAREESSAPEGVKGPVFDADGLDEMTYTPFVLSLQPSGEGAEARLELGDFSLLEETLNLEDALETDGNALGDAMLTDIHKFELLRHKDGAHTGGVFDNCEGDTVLFHFNAVEDAVRVAEHFLAIFTDKKALRKWIKVHRLTA